MSLTLVAAVGVAGALGAVARVVLDGVATSRLAAPFPYGILAVNVAGSLLLGVLAGWVLDAGGPEAWRVVVGTGFCGGFTTFSTVSVVSVQLALDDQPGRALANAAGTLLLTVAAAAAGLALGGLG